MSPGELVPDSSSTGRVPEPRTQRITPRWVRMALFENRLAFENEMERERRRLLDRELKRFWRARRA